MTLGGRRGPSAGAADLAPLHRRLGLLQVLRLGLAVIVSTTPLLLPGPLGDGSAAALGGLSAVYAGVSGALELVRRRLHLRSPFLVGGLVLFDGVFLTAVMSLTGGPQSVLAFLVLVHVVAVTLLLSFRAGLKAALWHALLLFLTSWLQRAGVVNEGPAASPGQAAVLVALALMVMAVATAWFSSLNEGQLRRGKAELRALAEMAGRMAATRRPSELVHALLRGVDEAFASPRAAVVLHDEADGSARAFVLGPDGELAEAAVGRGGDAVERVERPVQLERSLDGRDALLAAALPGARNVVVVPLAADGALGALAVEWGGGAGTRVTSGTVDLIGQFAAHAALALRGAALQAEVERLARTDALTGLANRRVFHEILARELASAARRGSSCGLVVVDVDHFKAVNDTYGHPAGDEVLRCVGRALTETCRGTDVPARYGGEEFAVIVPDCTPASAMVVAERVRAAIAQRPGPVPVTVSAGVATFPADAADGASLVAAADAALYRAKRLGRDRSVRYRRARRVRSLVEAVAS